MPIKKLRPEFSFTEERLKELEQVVPEAFADGKVNWEALKEALGEFLEEESQEHFGLNWPGKRESRRLATLPSKGTLEPQPGEGKNEGTTHNVFIEGENLEVLKLLQKSYAGRIKMIYIDPPYNTGNDFLYSDDYSEPLQAYLRRTGQKDEAGNLLTTNTRSSGRFHSNWLNMMLPRLILSWQLLSDDGVICVSIDDIEFHNLRQVMNEVFGEENFIDTIIWKKRYGGGSKEKYLVSLHEYVLFYAKNADSLNSLFIPLDPESIDKYYKSKDDSFEVRGPYRTHPLEAGKNMGARPNLVFPIPGPDGTEIWPERQWLWSRDRVSNALQTNDLEFIRGNNGKWKVHTKQYLRDTSGKQREAKAFSIIDDVFTQHGTNEIIEIFGDAQTFSYAKPTGLITRLLQIGTRSTEEDIVLDFFSGSCATADAVLKANQSDNGNRRFIMIQIPELTNREDFPTIAEIGKERIRRILKKLEAELPTGQDLGFACYKLGASNFWDWEAQSNVDLDQVEMKFDRAATGLIEGWHQDNLLSELLLLEGYPLNSRIEYQEDFLNNQIYKVTSDYYIHNLFVCLDKKINDTVISSLNMGSEDIFVCLDTALTDESKMQLADTANLHVI